MRGLRRFPLPHHEKDHDADDNHQDRADQNQPSGIALHYLVDDKAELGASLT